MLHLKCKNNRQGSWNYAHKQCIWKLNFSVLVYKKDTAFWQDPDWPGVPADPIQGTCWWAQACTCRRVTHYKVQRGNIITCCRFPHFFNSLIYLFTSLQVQSYKYSVSQLTNFYRLHKNELMWKVSQHLQFSLSLLLLPWQHWVTRTHTHK